MSPADQARQTMAIMSIGTLAILMLLYFVPLLISTWILYKKANKPGWASIIPVYNTIVMAEIGKKPAWMGVLAALSIVGQYLGALGLILDIVAIVFSLIILAAYLKQYSMGLGRQVLYVFLPIVFVFMVKNVRYIGGVQAPVQAQPAVGAPQAGQPMGEVVQPIAPQAPQTFGQTTEQSTQNDSINQNL